MLNEILPEGNMLPNQNYDAKNILCSMGMKHKRIHSYPDDCILYRKEFEELKRCPKYGLSYYKVKNGQHENNNEVTKGWSPYKGGLVSFANSKG